MRMTDEQAQSYPTVPAVIDRADLQALLDELETGGYNGIGPTVREGAIVYGPVRAVEDMPIGWTDRQGSGTYRLVRRHDQAVFGNNMGAQGWKRYLNPQLPRLRRAKREGTNLMIEQERNESLRWAFLGVRCDGARRTLRSPAMTRSGMRRLAWTTQGLHCLASAVRAKAR